MHWLFLLVLSACAEPLSYMGRPLARTMSHHGAPWLTRASREAQERPDLLYAALDLDKGDTACDIGSGNGYHSLRLARAVGKKGRVYAVDIQPEMHALLRARAAEAGVDTIEQVTNTQTSAMLPDGVCDVTLMVDVYHELAQPEPMLASLRSSLAKDGELVLVEFREEDPTVPIKPLHKMSKAQVHKELTANGFKLVGQVDTLPWQHVLKYQRTDGPDPAIQPTPWEP